MLERVLSFFRDLPAAPAAGADGDDPRVAAAALMYHVMDADGVRQDAEWDKLKRLLAGEYGVSGAELDALVQAGRQADNEAIDFYAFTSVLMRHLDEAQRVRFVRMLWDVAYADGTVHELEDNTLWRIADLLGVDRRERVATRRQAARDAHAEDQPPEDD